MNSTTICIIILAVFLISLAIYFIINKPTAEQIKKAKEFLSTIGDALNKVVIDSIKTLTDNNGDIKKYIDYESFKTDLLKSLYSVVWEFVIKTAKEEFGTNIFGKFLLTFITKQNVEELVNTIVASSNVSSMIDDVYHQQVNETIASISETEREAIELALAAERGDLEYVKQGEEFDDNYKKLVDMEPEEDNDYDGGEDTDKYIIEEDETIEILHKS